MFIGIDLGTTNSLVGTVVDGQVELFGGESDEVILPSVVAVGGDGRLLVGRRALNRRMLEPAATVQQIKRRMGAKDPVALGPDQTMSPQAISALIVGALIDRAEARLGQRPKRAVITVPAYFDDAQRQATLEAGTLAGLAVERLVNEPTAAAMTYTTGDEERVLVYDFGGGTFDVSVLERDEGFLEVKASHGDTSLGGSDIDRALVEMALERLGADAEAVKAQPSAMARLEAAMERAKIALSSQTEVEVWEANLARGARDVIHLEMAVTRRDLEEVARPFVERSLASVDRALEAAGWSPSSLDRVLLVGGTARMPMVADLLTDNLDRPVLLVEEPDLAVAKGASLLAGRLGGLDVDEILVDVTPHTLSVGAADRLSRSEEGELIAAPILERNTVVPVEKTSTFYTRVEDQERVEAPIAQGEGYTIDDNTWLGLITVDDLPPSPAGSAVDVTFRLDVSGVLEVTATHVPSGRQGSVTIKKSPTRLSGPERRREKESVDAFRALASSPATSEASESERRLAVALIERAVRTLEHRPADDPQTAAVEDARRALEAAVETRADEETLSERVDALSGALLDLA